MTADAEKLRGATEATMQVFQRIGQAMVQNQQAAQAASQEPGGETVDGEAGEPASDSDDVVEGEIVEDGS